MLHPLIVGNATLLGQGIQITDAFLIMIGMERSSLIMQETLTVKLNVGTNKFILGKQDNILRSKLNISIRRLIGQGIITNNKDIARDLKCSEPTVSQQRTGGKPLSEKFINNFERVYKISFATVVIPGKNKQPIINNVNTKLLILIANKIGVSKKELDKALL